MNVLALVRPISPSAQERFNLIVISWLFALSLILGFWLWNDYARVKERNEKFKEIYWTNLDQQKRYEAILRAEEERFGITNGK